MLSWMFSRTVWPAATTIPGLPYSAKPFSTALISLVPAGKSLNWYTPSLSVAVSIELPPCVVSNTVAPATGVPEGSLTTPRNIPVADCAKIGEANGSANTNPIAAEKIVLYFPNKLVIASSLFLFRFSDAIIRPRAMNLPKLLDAFPRLKRLPGNSKKLSFPLRRPRLSSPTLAQTPRRQYRRLSLRRCLQQQFNPSQQSNCRRHTILLPFRGHQHHRLALLKIAQTTRRQSAQHLLQVSSAPCSGHSGRPHSHLPRCTAAWPLTGKRSGRSTRHGRIRRNSLQSCRQALRHRRGQFPRLGIARHLHLHVFLGRQIRHDQQSRPRIHADNRSRDVAKRPGHNFLGGKFRAVFAPRAPRAHLVASLYLRQRARLGIIKFHRVRRISPHQRFSCVNRHVLPSRRVHRADHDRAARRIRALHQPANSVTLPLFALVGLLFRNVRF